MQLSRMAVLSRDLFTVPTTLPSLTTAQLSALKRQMPLLYLLLTINSATLAYTHYGLAPDALVFLPLIVLVTTCGLRGLAWLRLDLKDVAPERRIHLVRRTQHLTMVLSPVILVWSLSLAQYGNEVSNLHVFFFLAVTSIGCVFCLMHLRSAALVVAATVLAPAIVFVRLRQGAVPTSIAIDLLLVGGVMLFVLFTHYRDFVRLVVQNQTLEQLGEQNLELASADMLTGLPNRRTFFPLLEDAVARGLETGSSFLLGIIDLDGFKGINDTFGHVTGDNLLIEVADRLRRAVADKAVLARLGGDEFALISAQDVDDAELHRLGRHIIAAIALPFTCAGSPVRIGASIGFTRLDAGMSAALMIEQADFALYEAKAGSRGCWVVFADEHRTRMRLQGAIEDALRQADLETEFSLVFQPIVDVARGRTVAFEALARWNSPVLGPVPPARFIAIAERTGLIGQITLVLLGKALREVGNWPPEINLSFNLSVFDVTTPDARSRLYALVKESGIDPRRVYFELTETSVLNDFDQAKAGVDTLKSLGAGLCLDDFGTGFSSLSHLHRLPVDRLKIDQSFTREIERDNTARNIVASTLMLARNLGLDCVVEGVETRQQATLLMSLGCRIMQGFLLGEPMLAADIDAHLDDERRRTLAPTWDDPTSTQPTIDSALAGSNIYPISAFDQGTVEGRGRQAV